ncbi:MAG: hypothetical protein K6G53_09605 [Bacteroidales bacterium]|nr:hypothetical protein [Bacteroidales bacterium]
MMLFLGGCSKEVSPIYLPDPTDTADTSPLVTVIYDPGALGDLTYNDLIYEGVERAAVQYGLRTCQLSPHSKEEGLQYIYGIFDALSTARDSVRQLLIVAGSSYDEYVRANNHRLEANPNAELLYFETTRPLEGKGSSAHIAFYGAMYEAGAIARFFQNQALMVVANPEDTGLTDAVAGFQEGFESNYYEDMYDVPYDEHDLFVEFLADKAGKGFVIDDSTALNIIYRQPWDNPGLIIPICGGASEVFRRLAEYTGKFQILGVDRAVSSIACNLAAVKHADAAVERCIGQWLSEEGMPKHQNFSLADGYSGMVFCPPDEGILNLFKESFSSDMLESLHQDAIEKESKYAGR